MNTRALVIDDEIQIRRLLRTALEARGYHVHEAESGASGLTEAVFHKPDVILLDLGLPDMDGLAVLKRLREWSDVPVLILSVRDREDVKIAALEQGADDYVTKPFSTGELLARLAAIRRRRVDENESETTLGHIHVDYTSHCVTVHGAEVHLTPTEYALFKVLARHAGKVVTIKHLLREVWGANATEQSQYLRVYANRLRQKLALNAGPGLKLVNDPGVGYRLVIR
jgi:two-component system KDP operon response regulator KdpE